MREVKTPQGVLKFADVRINSKPSGATVMLVDNGKTSFLGSTPIATSLDPSRSYDVIFTLAGRPTQMAHLDPSKSSKLDVTLGRSVSRSKSSRSEAKEESKPKAEPKVETKVEVKAESKSRSKSKSGLADVVFEQPKAETKPDKKVVDKKAVEKLPSATDKKVIEKLPPATDDEDPLAKKPAKRAEPKAEPKAEPPKAEPAGQGTLMVSSKPPCEIWIDGKSTGLTTPQKAIALSAGTHKVTFVNEAAGIKKTVSVSITAAQPTKLIQDLMTK